MNHARIPRPDRNDTPGPDGWWNDFFTSDHARFQMALVEENHNSDAETQLLIRLGHIAPGSRILDAPCGHGRHAIRLAKAGAIVTGVDASPAMIERARRDAQEQNVRVSWLCADMRQPASSRLFDCAICLGGSFGYFGRRGDQDFLSITRQALAPDGILLLDMPSLESIQAHHKPTHEARVGDLHVMQQRHLDPATGMARIEVTVESERGSACRTYYQQLYQAEEIQEMLAASGFVVHQVVQASQLSDYSSNVGHVLLVAASRSD